MNNALASLPERHYRDGRGMYSVCSAHPVCLEAAALRAIRDGSSLLIEATSNQVDQFGGYTGMKPAAFRDWVVGLTGGLGLPGDRLILGGDHLGPNPWRGEPADRAMDKARELVRQYVAAGFGKIHLDCSMALGGDRDRAPGQALVAERAADLCGTAEKAAADAGRAPPAYVIGTEVPVPGGVAHELDNALEVTRAADAEETLETHRDVFARRGLDGAWSRVIALVVQPGVEFGNYSVAGYRRDKARALSSFIAGRGNLLFEAHSTDYQTATALAELVQDHFAILKVGPWLTWAYREALFGLAGIAAELTGGCGLRRVIDDVMTASPRHWSAHYHGTAGEQRLARAFSFSDRVRYYLPDPAVRKAIADLLGVFAEKEIPLPLLSQFLPAQYEEVREGRIANEPEALLRSAVSAVLALFAAATGSLSG